MVSPMNKFYSKKLTVEEEKLFEAAMENVEKKPSRNAKHVHIAGVRPQSRPRDINKPLIEKQGERSHSYLSAGFPVDVDRKTMLRLKRGHLRPESRLDLHGMSQSEAFIALVHFVTEAHTRGFRCILAITGKGNVKQGGGVLRKQFSNWLNCQELRPYILGFSEAQPRDGGGGAFYILIRRKRP